MKKIILLSLVFFTLLAGSCKKALDVDATRVVNEKNYWNTLEDARAGIMGVYGLTRAALADNNGHWLYGDVRMGNFDSPIRQDLKAIVRNDLNASYPVVQELSNWRRFYAIVNAANIFLERIGEVKAKDARYTANNMQVDIAQVRFLRAFAYFYMARIWGDVPFIISSRDETFENVGKTSKEAILEFVQAEMVAAALDLPYRYSAGDIQQPGNYYGESSVRWQGNLATKLGAYSVLSHVAAWQGKYTDVIKYTNEVLNNYTRVPNVGYVSTQDLTKRDGLFWDKNPNQLFAFGFVWGHQDASFTGNLESLTLANPVVNKAVPDIYVPKDSILSIFKEVGDARFNIDTTGVTHSDRYFRSIYQQYPIFNKIKVILGAEEDKTFRLFSSAIVFTRLEDVTLLRAEAYAVLGEQNRAIDDLNIIRQRRYNADQMGLLSNDLWVRYSAALHGPVIEAIFKERQKEFMGEGMRWYDKIRYEKIKQTNAPFLQMINSGKIFWPVSRTVLAQNPLLTQNPAWN